MDWAAGSSGGPSWTAADHGPTMLSFGGPSYSSSGAEAARLQHFSAGFAQPPLAQGLRGALQDARGGGRWPGTALLPAMQTFIFECIIYDVFFPIQVQQCSQILMKILETSAAERKKERAEQNWIRRLSR